MQAAEMGRIEKHTPEFGVSTNGAGKTVKVIRGRAREVRGVDDRRAKRKNSTFIYCVVR